MIGQVDQYTGFSGFLRNLIYFIAGVIPLNRKDPQSRKKVIEEAERILKKGEILIIYPEGTRTRTGELQIGRPGIAKIFLKTGVPILPVGIKGTFDLLPPGKGFPKIKKIIKINVGKPLEFKEEFKRGKKIECNSKEYQMLCQEITTKVMEEIKKLIES
jgi:1-acyl-sn-glycerol-3-phosphate acyltransferase